jgi:hypothetical protein
VIFARQGATSCDVARVEQEMERVHDAIVSLRNRLADEDLPGLLAITGCLESAALRRASMDLTRALAKMRSPNG